MSLRVQIMAHNDADRLRVTLESLPPDAEVVILDRGSTDGTADVAAEYGQVVLVGSAPRDEARNAHLGPAWTLGLDPGDRLVGGRDLLTQVCDGPPASYRLLVTQPDLITKEVRLFHRQTGLRYAGPVFESPHPAGQAITIGVVLTGAEGGPCRLAEVRNWGRSSPAAAEPLYYEACLLLAAGDYDGFLCTAAAYLFRSDGDSMPTVMTRYYQALVYCHVKRDAKRAVQELLVPLTRRPLMAEFWCLAGDVFYHLTEDYARAERLYRAAMTMGAGRRADDPWPVHLSKYRDYPLKMAESCKAIREQARVLRLDTRTQP